MKTKDFFRLVIKLFGLYLLVIYVFQALPNTILPYFYLFNDNNEWVLSIWPTIKTLLLVVLFFFLTFNPDFFIEKLKLDKGFDSDIIGLQNLNAKSILNVGIILTGGLILIENLAPFLNGSFLFIKSKVASSEELRLQSNLDTQGYVRLGINILNMIIGYVLLTNYQAISKFLLPKKDSSDKEN